MRVILYDAIWQYYNTQDIIIDVIKFEYSWVIDIYNIDEWYHDKVGNMTLIILL